MNFIDFIFFFYTFIAIYMLSLMIMVYFTNRKDMFSYNESVNLKSISVIIPCYNEGKNIEKVINSLNEMDYPKELLEIIVVDDCSQDNSVDLIQKCVRKYGNVQLIVLPQNSGGAAKPTNIGIQAAKYDYILVTDSDAFAEKNTLKKMMGVLQSDEKIGGVTCSVLVHEPKNFIQKLQHIEYIVIAFARKLLDFIDSVYVTPGPFALYKKKVLLEIGLFEEGNLTQDIEIVWKMMAHGYKARMVLPGKVYVDSPPTFKSWWSQRVRWNVGGTQTLWKYRKWSLKSNMLGMFVIPFFAVSMFLGMLGLGLFFYLGIREIILFFFSVSYSVGAQSSILSLVDLSLNMSILNFFGFALFFMGTMYSLFAIWAMKEVRFKNLNFFNTFFFLTLYLMIYPLVMIAAIWRIIKGDYSWGRTIKNKKNEKTK